MAKQDIVSTRQGMEYLRTKLADDQKASIDQHKTAKKQDRNAKLRPKALKTKPNGHLAMSAKMDQSDDEDTLADYQSTTSAADFLSGNSSESGDEATGTVLSGVYQDPLDTCMEAIEDLAAGILRSGKLTTQGEPGDMSKLQPILFGLQATEQELPQLLPQLMQTPFFNKTIEPTYNGYLNGFSTDVLSKGYLRVGLAVDTAIYHLLHSHCAKGAKQAEGLIKTAQVSRSNLPSTPTVPQLPPVIFPSVLTRPSPIVRSPPRIFSNGFHGRSSQSDPSEESQSTLTSTPTVPTALNSQASSSSVASSFRTSTSSFSSLNEIAEHTTLEDTPFSTAVSPHDLNGRHRKITRCHLTSSSSDLSGDEGEYWRVSQRHLPENVWETRFVDNQTIVGMYGASSYPLLLWNPDLHVEFKIGSSVGLLTGPLTGQNTNAVTGIDPSQPTVTMKVVNTLSHRIAFSIRVHRQSAIFDFTSHVVYPTQGLATLEGCQCWEESAEFFALTQDKNDYFIVDLFVCTLDGEHPSWNIVRKYAVMKAVKNHRCSSGANPPRSLSRKMSHCQLPGNLQQKEDNLKQTIAHGLQCVVKSKLDEAEVIFSQALLLPEFQRITLKSFAYICLAVIANKQRKAGHVTSPLPVLTHVNNSTLLVEICEVAPCLVKMPRTLQLVKQLGRELNITKILKEQKRKEKRVLKLHHRSSEDHDEISPDGGTITHDSITLVIPPGALGTSTKTTLSKPKMKQLQAMLRSSGWDKTVQLATVLNIQCSPATDHFALPVNILAKLSPNESATHVVRLLQSNYLRQWHDITDDPHSRVILLRDEVQITTDHVGWLAVVTVNLDPARMAQMALDSFRTEPILLQLSAYAQVFPDSLIQIVIFATPYQNGEQTHPNSIEAELYSPISFPHTIQAWAGERVRLSLQGQLEPDTSSGERDLSHEFEVQQSYNQICEKWVRLSGGPLQQSLRGKLFVDVRRNDTDDTWENLVSINLTSRASLAGTAASTLTE